MHQSSVDVTVDTDCERLSTSSFPTIASSVCPTITPSLDAPATSPGMLDHVTCDFIGQRVHFVQIGLGTNSTCIQNLCDDAGWTHNIAWLLKATTADPTDPSQTRGISVEPMEKHVEALRPYVQNSQNLSLIRAAIGAEDSLEAAVFGIDRDTVDSLLAQVPEWQHEDFRHALEYILNMSRMDSMHYALHDYLTHIWETFRVHINIQQFPVSIWSWKTLVKTCNFAGCEVLIIDTEGYDAKILRSMLTYCRNTGEWPSVIQFETMGHCDDVDGHGTEWAVIGELESAGYIVLGYSWLDTHLVHREAPHSTQLQDWLETWQCEKCGTTKAFPYIRSESGTFCSRCSSLPCYEPQPSCSNSNGWIPFWQYNKFGF